MSDEQKNYIDGMEVQKSGVMIVKRMKGKAEQ